MQKIIFLMFLSIAIVKLIAQEYSILPYTTNFESGTLDDDAGENLGIVKISSGDTDSNLNSGIQHLIVGKSEDGTKQHITNEAILHLNLDGETNVDLNIGLTVNFDDIVNIRPYSTYGRNLL